MGVNRRDALVAQAVADAKRQAARGLSEFSITVHSVGGGMQRLDRVVPHVAEGLQVAGFGVVNVNMTPWTYDAHFTVRTSPRPTPVAPAAEPAPDIPRRPCDRCGEMIAKAARMCRFCGLDVEPHVQPEEPEPDIIAVRVACPRCQTFQTALVCRNCGHRRPEA